MRKYLLIIVLTIVYIFCITIPINAETETVSVKAKVIVDNGVKELAEEKEHTKKIQNIVVRILEGEYENEEYDVQYILSENIEGNTSNIELKKNDNILVSLEEKEGEITNIRYINTINSNVKIYIIGLVLLTTLLIISRKRAIIVYVITILLIGTITIFSLKNGWNLIAVSCLLSLIITIILFISINSINRKTLYMIVKVIIGTALSGILIYLLFDIFNLNNINIKISEKFINIKELVVSSAILLGCVIYSAIIVSIQYMSYTTNKLYKTKSDNIIDGQRSLKL